jgi:hypothetical protein
MVVASESSYELDKVRSRTPGGGDSGETSGVLDRRERTRKRLDNRCKMEVRGKGSTIKIIRTFLSFSWKLGAQLRGLSAILRAVVQAHSKIISRERPCFAPVNGAIATTNLSIC